MPLVTFKPNGKTVNVESFSSLLSAAKLADISVEIPCGGNGVCGKCLIRVLSGDVDYHDTGSLPKSMMDDGYVLICKTDIKDSDVVVHTVTDLSKEKGKFSHSSEDMLHIDEELMPKPGDFDPIAKQIILTVSKPVMGDGLSDYDRFKKGVLNKLGGTEIDLPVSMIKILPEILRSESDDVTLTYCIKGELIKIVSIEPASEIDVQFGIAVDIGTTTIAVQLVSMKQGDIISSKTNYNSQIECGLDVISRINYARKPEKLEELRMKVLTSINRIIKELTTENKVDPQLIFNASLAGNTTMVHLLLGIPPEYIRLEPYTPAVYQVPIYKASEIGIDIAGNAPVYIAPSVGSYLGGDITSGILCTSLATECEDLCLFIDIGTNGEIVLGNNEFLMGCACSAGPAFEGGSIENGMRASQGAIERVLVDKETGVAQYFTIGNKAPLGICGSGMISLIASLLETGWIDPAGKLNRNIPSIAIDTSERNAKYIIAPANEAPRGKDIYITESDIDNLIRAKAAIFSACAVMLESIDMSFSDLTKIYIAGGFGRYLDVEKSITIGLIPDLPAEKYVFIGNSSMIGAYMTLLSKNHRRKEIELSQKITYLDLSTEAGYMDQYTGALFLPHTDARLFPSAQKNKK